MCTRTNIWRVSTVFTFLVLALVGLGIGLREVVGKGCFLGYSRYATTCAEADELGNFQFLVGTSYYSQNKGPWVVVLVPRNSINDGLVDGSPFTYPTSVLIREGVMGLAAGEIVSACTGTLEDVDTDGSYQINVLDTTEFACSGGHDVMIRTSGDDCR